MEITMRTILISTVVCCVILLGAALTDMAQAQDTRGSWFPQSNPPPISPWTQMDRRSTSELDSYHQYVKPRIDMENQLMAQHREMNRQRDIQKKMQNEIKTFRDSDYSITGAAGVTGKQATYRNYLHYYSPRTRR